MRLNHRRETLETNFKTLKALKREINF